MAAAGDSPDRARADWRALGWLVTALVLLAVGHDIDHVVNESRIGELSAAFWLLLPFQYAVLIGVLVLVWRRHELAATVAAALAALYVLAFVGSHLMPFGPLPYADGDPPWISWALVFVPMAVGTATLAAALRLRSLDRAPSAATSSTA